MAIDRTRSVTVSISQQFGHIVESSASIHVRALVCTTDLGQGVSRTSGLGVGSLFKWIVKLADVSEQSCSCMS